MTKITSTGSTIGSVKITSTEQTTIVRKITVGTPIRGVVGATGTLSGLEDINITSVSHNDFLQYDSASGKFVNKASPVFKTISSSLIPSADSAHDLGSAAAKWRDLYLSGSTLNLGGLAIRDQSGTFSVADSTGTPVNFDLTGSQSQIRGFFSSGGDITYDSSTGQFSIDVEATYTKANFDSDFNVSLDEAALGGTGLTFDSASNTLSITNTGVDSAVYGSSTRVPVLTINSRGQVDSAGTVLVAGVTGFSWDSATGTATISTADGQTFPLPIKGFGDNQILGFGDNSDLRIDHNGSVSRIRNYTGDLQITNTVNDKDVRILSDDGSGGVIDYFRADGSTGEAKLYHYGSEKVKTDAYGIDVTGRVNADSATFTNLTRAATVDSATYGSATAIPVLTVNTSGFIDSIGTVNVAGVSSTSFDSASRIFTINTADGGTFSTMIATRDGEAGTYGSATQIPVLTINAFGQVDSIGTTTVAGVSSTSYDSSTGIFTINTADGNSFATHIQDSADLVRISRAGLSATDAGGDGSFTYNSLTGVFTYTGPSASEVRAHITANKGVSIASGEINIDSANVRGMFSATDAGGDGSFSYNSGTGVFTYTGPSAAEVKAHFQPLDSNANPTFNQVRGPAEFIIDPAAIGNATGTVKILGNLQVEGTQTTINSTTVSINDKNIVIADSAADSSALNGGGITWGGSNIVDTPSLTYDHSNAEFDFNRTITSSGNRVLTTADEGSGNGLDADTLDNIQSSGFLRSNVEDAKTSGNLNFSDNVMATFGADSDLKIYHDGSNSVIRDDGTGNLKIRSNTLQIMNAAGGKNGIVARQNAEAELYYNGVERFATTTYGATVTGSLVADSATFTNVSGNGSGLTSLPAGQLTGTIDSARIPSLAAADIVTGIFDSARLPAGAFTDTTVDSAFVKTVQYNDNEKLIFGNDSNLQIYNNAQTSYIDNRDRNFQIRNLDENYSISFIATASGNDQNTNLIISGTQVAAYYLASERLRTTSTGIRVKKGFSNNGEIIADSATFDANVAAATFSGSGASLTSLNASNLSSGTVDSARIPLLATADISSGIFDSARIPAIEIDANKIASGTISDDRLPSSISSDITGTAATATNVTTTTNNTTNETVFLTFVDGTSGAQGIEIDHGLTYNPAYGKISTNNLDVDSADIGNVNITSGTVSGDGQLALKSGLTTKSVEILNGSTQTIVANGFGSVPVAQLNYNGSQRLVTDAYGVDVTGRVNADSATFTNVSGNGSGLTSLSAGQLTGTIDSARIPLLATADISSGIFDSARIPAIEIDANRITSGTISDDRLPSSISSDITGNAATATTATTATNVTASANNSTNETVYLTFVDGATGAQGIETDTGLTYNPSSGLLTTVKITADSAVFSLNATVGGNRVLTTADEGSGNGLDADTLDGVHGSSFLRSDAADTKTSGTLSFSDNVGVAFGSTSGEQLTIGKGSGFSLIDGEEGALLIQCSPGDVSNINDQSYLDLINGYTRGDIYVSLGQFGDFLVRRNTKNYLKVSDSDNNVVLYYDGDKKLETTDYGVTVTGTVNADSATFTNVSGNGSGLTSLNASNLSSGTVDSARLPSLATADIVTGTFDSSRIPTLAAADIVTGTIANARLDAQLQDVAGLATTDGGFIVGNGSNFVLETGSTARASLGLAIGTNVLAYDANLQSFVTAFTLPTSDGNANQVLQTNGSGTLSFVDQTGGGGGGGLDSTHLTNGTFSNIDVDSADIGTLNIAGDLITSNASSTVTIASGSIGKNLTIKNYQTDTIIAKGDPTSPYAQLNYGGSSRLTTDAYGVDVTGRVNADSATIGGVNIIRNSNTRSTIKHTDALAQLIIGDSTGHNTDIHGQYGVNLIHAGSTKLGTSAYGVNVTGKVDTDSADIGILNIDGAGAVTSTGSISFTDGGSSNHNISFYHGSDQLMLLRGDGNVYLKSSGSTKLVTSAYGVTVTGTVNADSATIGGINISSTTIAASSAATLKSSAVGKDVVLSNGTTQTIVGKGSSNPYAQLNYNGSLRLATNAYGATVTGTMNADSATISGNLTVSGDLTVSGTTTTINTETINLADNNIVLNSNHTGTPTQNAGITVERGSSTDKVFQWNETSDYWEFDDNILVSGNGTSKITSAGGTATLEIIPDGNYNGWHPNLLLRSQNTGAVIYMLSNGYNLAIGRYNSGVPSDPSDFITFKSSDNDTPELEIGDAGSTTSTLGLGAQDIVGTSTGVGIGLTAPTSPLTIKSSSVSSAASGLSIQANSSTNDIVRIAEKNTDGGRFHMYEAGVEKIAFYTDGTDNHISAGNLGLGTTSPTEKFEVYPDTDVSAVIGRAHIGNMGHSDYAGFSHVDQNGTGTFALMQHSSGDTYLNAPSGQAIYLRNANTTIATVGGSGLLSVDNKWIAAGTGADLQMLHNGSNSFFTNAIGDLSIIQYANDKDILIQSDDGSGGTADYFRADGSTGDAILYHYGSEKLKTQSTGVSVTGLLSATTKSFIIDHPTKPNHKLRYGSLEGPENGVYVRGRLKGGNVIELPDYWKGLVHEDSITVELTAIGKHQKLYVEDFDNTKVIVGNDNLMGKEINCFYTVYGERKDVDKLEVEYED